MELKEYLGSSIIDDVKLSISDSVKDFCNQSSATKLALADQNNYALSFYEKGVNHLFNIIDDEGAEIELLESKVELLENEVDRYQRKYGEISQEFIDKQKSVVVVRDSEKSHAKKACQKYIQKHESNQRN